MNLDEVVGKVPECNGSDMVLDLLREGISQPSEPANRHPHRQIMPLDIAGVDVLRVWVAGNCVALASQAHGGAVAPFRAFGYAVNLHQHRVVHIARKRLIDRLDVKLQSITSKLNAIRQTARKVFDEIAGALGIAFANQPAGYQLGISVNRGPEPRIARAGVLRGDIGRHVLLLGVAKRPTFINLHPLACEVLENPRLVLSAERANLEHQPHDGLFGHAGYADGRTDGVAFNQATDDLSALFGSEAVHASIMHYRLRIVKTLGNKFQRKHEVVTFGFHR